MIDVKQVSQVLRDYEIDAWADCVEEQLSHRLKNNLHGHTEQWNLAVASLPDIVTETVKLAQGLVQIGAKPDSTREQREQVEASLRVLEPWRKGPYQIHGVFIDTEWRSDWKWDRVLPHIESLEGRRVLDVGCGNGYHCWRMAGEGAELVIGIDPTQLFLMQFLAVKHFVSSADKSADVSDRVHFLPLGIEQVPRGLHAFDTVFSMGVLYHRRSPIDHLQELKAALRPGGELVLETLVVEGNEQQLLIPKNRYAKMRNVWFIPSVLMLELWLMRAGFTDIRTVDVTTTSTEEQRSTDWMRFESLADFLDPADTSLTVEGYPAPCRAIVLARA